MKNRAQRRIERKRKKEARQNARSRQLPSKGVPVDIFSLAPDNSYSTPEFAARGYYVDQPFRCQSCGKEQVWTAHQQKWWYEVAKGGRWTVARLCRTCRQRERARREGAKKIHLEGIARKKAKKASPSA
jgi:hypothetical protein